MSARRPSPVSASSASAGATTRPNVATAPIIFAGRRVAFVIGILPCPKADRIRSSILQQFADVRQAAGDGGGGGHGRAHQVRTAAATLASLEVAVGGGGATLAGLQLVGIHGEAHGAARLAP